MNDMIAVNWATAERLKVKLIKWFTHTHAQKLQWFVSLFSVNAGSNGRQAAQQKHFNSCTDCEDS